MSDRVLQWAGNVIVVCAALIAAGTTAALGIVAVRSIL